MTTTDNCYLLVDDDQAFSHVLKRALEKRGMEVCVAENREQTLEHCRRKQFDRIVLDLRLADENGLTLIPDIKQTQSSANILILTGYSSIPTAVKAIQLGAINYLCKPADTDEIIQAFTPGADSLPEAPVQPPSVERLEWEHIQKVLDDHEGNISATARALGMHRRTLQRKLQKRPKKQ